MANALTLIRVLLTPLVVYALVAPVPGGNLTAAALFGAAALTDLFDGILARKTKTVTEFGRVADPLADRLLILCVLGALVYRGDLPLWAAGVVIGRDLLMVMGYRLVQTAGSRPQVSTLGKVSTATLMISIAMLVLEAPFALPVFYVGMLLSVVSGIAYVTEYVRDGRQRSSGQAQT